MLDPSLAKKPGADSKGAEVAPVAEECIHEHVIFFQQRANSLYNGGHCILHVLLLVFVLWLCGVGFVIYFEESEGE